MLPPTTCYWDAERFSWETLRASGSARKVPEAICRLAAATNNDEADRYYWLIDNVVIVQGGLYEATVPAVSCVVLALPFASPLGRERLLEFLSQVANGHWSSDELSHVPPDWPEVCRREILRGSYFFLGLLPSATPSELEWCVDLLTYCAEWDPTLRPAVSWHLDKLLEVDRGALTEYIRSRADEVKAQKGP